MKYLIVFFIALGICSCASNESIKDQEQVVSVKDNVLQLSDVQLKSFTMTSTAVSERFLEETIVLNGIIEIPPQSLLSVSSVYGGRVKSIKVRPGMTVKKGQVLVELEDNQLIQLQQDYLITDAQLQNAKVEYHRQRDLNENKASSDKVYLQAKADYEVLLINHRSLIKKLELANIQVENLNLNTIRKSIVITAPFDGFVKEVFVNTGKYVDATEMLLDMVNPQDLQLTLKMFEKDWGKVKVGQQLVAYTNSAPNQKYQGEVILLGRNMTGDKSVDILAKLQNMSDKLIPGMYMSASITVPESKANVLPEDCVLDFEGGKYVFEIIDRNTFKMIPINCGMSRNGWVEIVDIDSLVGKKIVQQGAYTLLMALKNEGEE